MGACAVDVPHPPRPSTPAIHSPARPRHTPHSRPLRRSQPPVIIAAQHAPLTRATAQRTRAVARCLLPPHTAIAATTIPHAVPFPQLPTAVRVRRGNTLGRAPVALATAGAGAAARTSRPATPPLPPLPPRRPLLPLEPPTVMTSFPAHLHPDTLANGLLLIDKPQHWEVPEVVTAVQRATRARKVASIAPLDAAASGLMLLCFGAATRLASRVERAAKRYEGSMVLGAAAAAADVRGGSFVSEALPWEHVTDGELQEAADGMMALMALSGGGSSGDESDEGDDDGDDDDGAADNGSVSGGGGAAAAGTTVQVLPPRFRLRQYPSSFNYYEEDDGPSIHTTPLRLHEFKAWRASEEDILRAAAAAAAAAKSPAAAAARAGLGDPRVGDGNTGSGGSVVAAPAGRIVRFSMLMSGRAHVRSLVAMYGRRLRTCACLDELRRTQVGSLDVGDAWPLEAVLPILQRYKR